MRGGGSLRRPAPSSQATPVHPGVSPAAVVIACAVLALTTAGLGLGVAFRGVAPWNGAALGLIVVAAGLAWTSTASVRRRHGGRPVHRRQ